MATLKVLVLKVFFSPFKSSSECQVRSPTNASLTAVFPLHCASLEPEGQIVIFLPQSLHRLSSDSHETQLTCRVKVCSPVTGASNYHSLFPYQCPYPPAVTCLGSARHFQLGVCVCVRERALVFYPCSSSSLNLGQTLLEFRLSSSHWDRHFCNLMCKCVVFQAYSTIKCSIAVVLFLNGMFIFLFVFLVCFGLIEPQEIALWLIAVVCDLYSRCNSPTPQGLHTSAIVPVTYWSPSPWQHHEGGLSPWFYCRLLGI